MNFWNIMDCLLFICFIVLIALTSINNVAMKSQNVIMWVRCAIIILANAKICFFLRIFEGIGFIVRMLISVLRDLKSFIFFFFTVILVFAELLAVTMKVPEASSEDKYHGIGFVRYFAVVLRNSIGDYDFDSMFSEKDHIWLSWLIWLFVIFIGNVVFMNFIIAVVSDSYEKCINKMETQSLLEKIELIIEREQMLSKAEVLKYKDKWFPRYLYVCKVVSQTESNNPDDSWEGVVKEIKKMMAKGNNQRLQEKLHR